MGPFIGLFSCDVNSSFLVSSVLPSLTLICLWKSKSELGIWIDMLQNRQQNWKQAQRVSNNHEKRTWWTLGRTLGHEHGGNGEMRTSQPHFHSHRQSLWDIWVTWGMISQLSFCLLATQNLLLYVTFLWSYSVPRQSQFHPCSKWKIKER